MSPGSSARYLLGAKDGQFLEVTVVPRGGARLEYQIFNPEWFPDVTLDQVRAVLEHAARSLEAA